MKKLLRTIPAALVALAACAVGPNYHRPPAETPRQFKEAPGWQEGEPADTLLPGAWWVMFGDSLLDSLENLASHANQSVVATEAQYRQARALISVARAAYYPAVSGQVGYTRIGRAMATGVTTGTGAVVPTGAVAPQSFNDYLLQADVAWEADVWGGIRRSVEAGRATAQASAAQSASVLLSIQAALAQDYFLLRVDDLQRRLLDSTVVLYKRFLNLTELLLQQGVASEADVLAAETQLNTAQAQAIDIGVQRSQLEHVIAQLAGIPSPLFTIEPEDSFAPTVVAIPAGLPVMLLQRRPDVASAERLVAAANAQIGVAKAAYFPTLTLDGAAGFESRKLSNWLSWPNFFWSFGGNFIGNIFQGGARVAQVRANRAAWEAAVANYRQTVLTAFQEVEDNLAALRILGEEENALDLAAASAASSTGLTLARYRQGVASALDVITTQTVQLNNERAALAVLGSRMTALVQLIKAIGGGWDAAPTAAPQ